MRNLTNRPPRRPLYPSTYDSLPSPASSTSRCESKESSIRLARAACLTAIFTLLGNVTACRTRDTATAQSSEIPGSLLQALDSCPTARPSASSQSARQEPEANPLSHGSVRDFGKFSIFIPDDARVRVLDSASDRVTLGLPGCPDCEFEVRVHGDSGVRLDARVASIVARQRSIDSINRNPGTKVHEFDEIDSPPREFVGAAGRGVMLDNSCGDCASVSLLWGHSGYIADVSFGGDDNVPDLAQHLCEMTAIGKTFTWRGGGERGL